MTTEWQGEFFDIPPTVPEHRCRLPKFSSGSRGWRCDAANVAAAGARGPASP